MSDHRCHEGANPRCAGRCVQCGAAIPPPPELLVRSLEFERGSTLQAAKGLVDPGRLIDHAEQRALALSGEYVRDPMHIAPGRDRRRDVREELADARNHLLWDMQAHLEDEDRAAADLIALRHICLAYDRLLEED